jgi:hypothetical protein
LSGRGRRRLVAAAAWAWNGRYWPEGWRLRRSSRLIVEADLAQVGGDRCRAEPFSSEIGDPDPFVVGQESGRDHLVDDGSRGGTILTVPSFNRTVVPFFQTWAIERLTPISLQAARIDQPSARSSMKRRRANDFGRRPGPLGTRRVDNETSRS